MLVYWFLAFIIIITIIIIINKNIALFKTSSIRLFNVFVLQIPVTNDEPLTNR